jgi:transcriptional regulator with XRE-family HTH domain
MGGDDSAIDRKARSVAVAFGASIRSRRKALQMRQDQLALATGVGRRFLIELEGGKASCQLGRSLLVAQALGLSLPGLASSHAGSNSSSSREEFELPDLPEELEEPDGQPVDLF